MPGRESEVATEQDVEDYQIMVLMEVLASVWEIDFVIGITKWGVVKCVVSPNWNDPEDG